jgi:hypothetical protein
MEEIKQVIVKLEETDEEPSSFLPKIALSKNAFTALKLALEYDIGLFYTTHIDHDDSIEIIHNEHERIILFRQEGVVVTARSFYKFDLEDHLDFLETFE